MILHTDVPTRTQLERLLAARAPWQPPLSPVDAAELVEARWSRSP